jgi:hypothetical protein
MSIRALDAADRRRVRGPLVTSDSPNKPAIAAIAVTQGHLVRPAMFRDALLRSTEEQVNV